MPVLKSFEAIGKSNKSWTDAVETVLKRSYKTIVGLKEMEILGWTASVDSKGKVGYEARVLIYFELVDELEPHA